MSRRRGFTLIELLVVVGMLAALMAFLLPAMHRAYLVAQKSAIASDLQVIGNALEAYRGDFGDYPRPGGAIVSTKIDGGKMITSGAQILCWALLAPGPMAEDGADGPGFRLRGTTGQVYGPYLPPDRFVVGMSGRPDDIAGVVPYSQKGVTLSDWFGVLADRRGRVIMYYPAHKRSNPGSVPGSYVGAGAMWDPGEGDPTGLLMPDYCLRNLLGAAPDGSLARGAMPVTAPFLLISAGTAEPAAHVRPGSAFRTAGSGPNSFGQADNVANVPLSPRLPIANNGKS